MSGSYLGAATDPWREAPEYSIEAKGWAGHFAGKVSRDKTLGEFTDLLDKEQPQLTWTIRPFGSMRGTHLIVIDGLKWIQHVVPGDDLVLAEIRRLQAEKSIEKAAKGLEEVTKAEALELARKYLATGRREDPESWLIRKRQEQGWNVP